MVGHAGASQCCPDKASALGAWFSWPWVVYLASRALMICLLLIFLHSSSLTLPQVHLALGPFDPLASLPGP